MLRFGKRLQWFAQSLSWVRCSVAMLPFLHFPSVLHHQTPKLHHYSLLSTSAPAIPSSPFHGIRCKESHTHLRALGYSAGYASVLWYLLLAGKSVWYSAKGLWSNSYKFRSTSQLSSTVRKLKMLKIGVNQKILAANKRVTKDAQGSDECGSFARQLACTVVQHRRNLNQLDLGGSRS